MRVHTRLTLPPLGRLNADSVVGFAVLDRMGTVLDTAELALNVVRSRCRGPVYALLHQDDAIVAQIDVPPVPARHLDAAIAARIEPMLIGDLADVVLAHGPRQASGRVAVAWSGRKALQAASQTLHTHGLQVHGWIPFSLAQPTGTAPNEPAMGAHSRQVWQSALPGWFLAVETAGSAVDWQRWRGAVVMSCACAFVWLAGLQLYAIRLNNEMQSLGDAMVQSAQALLPRGQIVLDPLKQARQQLATWQARNGKSSSDDFIVMAGKAAHVLQFAQGQVVSANFTDGRLTLELAQGYKDPDDPKALQQQAARYGLVVQRLTSPERAWQIENITDASRQEPRP